MAGLNAPATCCATPEQTRSDARGSDLHPGRKHCPGRAGAHIHCILNQGRAAAGRGTTPHGKRRRAHVLTLAQEVLKTMFLTKLKLGTVAVLCAGLFAALAGGSFTSWGVAQDPKPGTALGFWLQKKTTTPTESDTDFIRRLSKDLRGTVPTPAEIHFFIASKDAGKRQSSSTCSSRNVRPNSKPPRVKEGSMKRLFLSMMIS